MTTHVLMFGTARLKALYDLIVTVDLGLTEAEAAFNALSRHADEGMDTAAVCSLFARGMLHLQEHECAQLKGLVEGAYDHCREADARAAAAWAELMAQAEGEGSAPT